MPATIKLTTKFADNSTRALNIGTFDSNNPAILPPTVKAKIKALNADPSEIAPFYLSIKGKPFTEISECSIVTENITEIDLS